ncbi:MAG TPA: CvpA family protein [Candidatus Nanoarchaeia archaeon]|nr:CvpA family protein [Candidatus Nanoarchaeia archaeon]
MSNFDIILIVILGLCALRGLTTGLIKAVGAFLGIIGGAFFASHFYLALFAATKTWYGGYDNIGKVASFIIIFIVSAWLIHLLFIILDKTYNILAIIPFMKSINRLAGGILYLLVGAIVLGLLIYVAAKYAPAGTMVGNWLLTSKIAPWLLDVAKILMPLISGSLKNIQSIL